LPDPPRLLVIERHPGADHEPGRSWLDGLDVVKVRSMSRALALLREQEFTGVYVDRSQLPALRWAGTVLQADEVLEAIAEGVAVADPQRRLVWWNPRFQALAADPAGLTGADYYRALGVEAPADGAPDPFARSAAARRSDTLDIKAPAGRHLRVTVTPVFDHEGALIHWIALTRDITADALQEEKLKAIHKAGEELADLRPDDLAALAVEERTELLKHNIISHMKELLGFDFFEIRLLDLPTGRLLPLLNYGLTATAATRELVAREEGQGVTGRVAATGKSYLCRETIGDPYYLEGIEGARSSLTVPLIDHGEVVGTLNVESRQQCAFGEAEQRLLEIYAGNIASALHTLELLQAERSQTATASLESIRGELDIPVDEILNSATTALDRYAGHDDEIISRLRRVISRAREIRFLIDKAGERVLPATKPAETLRLKGKTILVADAEIAVRRSVHQVLRRLGAVVETASDAREAIALARQNAYSLALVDIRLPDLPGYETFHALREVQPDLPIVFITGFGYDPSHAIVKAKREGLKLILYKPFRADKLLETVDQGLASA
jgi:CheY-like chemotaxis protein